MNLVECVPNISEGQNPAVIEQLAATLQEGAGVRLLHIDRGVDAHRTVFTFAAPVGAIAAVAFRFVSRALSLIDMRAHHGVHERNGAVDVVPFVPIGDTTMAECIAIAHQLAVRVADELAVPVYLYGDAALVPQRRHLAAIRKGQYEGLRAKLADPAWKPDAGPVVWNEIVARAGSVQIGARPFLIAWNINLDTRGSRTAAAIAARIRESGNGKGQPGLFRGLKARGWYMKHFDCAQVTMNLTDFHAAPMHRIFDTVSALADAHGTRVTGSELVGLVPLAALTSAGRFYLNKAHPGGADTTEACIDAAVRHFGLSHLSPFVPEKRIVEFCLVD